MYHLRFIIALLISVLALTTPQPTYAETAAPSHYMVNGNGVRLRAKPSVTAPELDKLALGTRVTLLQKTPTQSTVNGKTAYWYQIKTDKATGWVFGSFLTPATHTIEATIKLLRTKLKAEVLSFEDAVAAYQLANKTLPQAKTRNEKGELELDKWVALQRSYDSIPADQMQQPPYYDWYKQHYQISFDDEISGQYLVKAETFWALADRYKKDAIGDEIAWRAAQQRLGGECEGFIGCSSMASQRTDGEYLKRFPQGRYVKAALQQVRETFKYMLQEWNKPEQDTSDVNLTEWTMILKPQANNPNAKQALSYLKQLQAVKKK